MEKYCISVDWLQVYCRCNHITEGVYANEKQSIVSDGSTFEVQPYTFELKLLPHSTPIYKNVFEVHSAGMKVAEVCNAPKTEVIARDSVAIKLENRVLYSHVYIELLYALISALKAEYISTTRIDLCYDCNKLKGGRDVGDFLYQFLTAKAGQIGHIVRKGSTRFTCNGSKKWSQNCKVTSMRWGSPTVSPAGYCYNKTLELIEVKDKPWIRETWQRNGLVSFVKQNELDKLSEKDKQYQADMYSLRDYIVTPVWRFEISIKSEGMKLLDMGTGELFKLSPAYMHNQKVMEEMFYTYAAKVFDFRENTGQKNVRFYHQMELFENSGAITKKPIKVCKYSDTGRSEKMCYNKLVKMSREYTELAEIRVWGLREALSFLSETAGLKRELVRSKEHESYLNELMGHKFEQSLVDELMHAMEQEKAAENGLLRDLNEDMVYP